MDGASLRFLSIFCYFFYDCKGGSITFSVGKSKKSTFAKNKKVEKWEENAKRRQQ
jgi:hypothetical protein